MAKTKVNGKKNSFRDEEENIKGINEMLREERNNPAVENALKKEKQPVTPEDFSPLHNNQEAVTTGKGKRRNKRTK